MDYRPFRGPRGISPCRAFSRFISRFGIGGRRGAYLVLVLLGLPAARTVAQTDEISTSRRTALVRAVDRVRPAVVNIHVMYRERIVRQGRDPFWDFFFPFDYAIQPDRTSTGSGLIVNLDGYILTNGHVIGDPESVRQITVSLPDGRTLEASHIASDINFDLAVLKVKERNLPIAPLGDSSDILVGEWVIAIGNPFDLGPTVSVGVVSALNRDFPEPQGNYYYRDMIQTDAAINPGNSGGPLVNALGQVIGINSFIYTGSNYSIGSIGIGFAIPIGTARIFLDEIQKHGQVRRPWTGILYLQDLTRPLAEYLSLASTEGALVVQVDSDSPAKRAGLERGDVITAINAEKVRSADEAISILRGFRVDDECVLAVFRQGRTLRVRLRLEELPRYQRRWH
jgi:serine protease Do